MIFSKKKIIYFLFLFFTAQSSSYAMDNVCPGEPQTLYWGSINISTAGTCSSAASIPACSFSVSKNGTSSSVITTSNSCSVSLTCDGITANDSLNINPNQSRCCGNWDLAAFPTWDTGSGTCKPPLPTGTLNSSADSCLITTGASTCSVNLTWTTTGAVTTSAITTSVPAPNTVLYSANNGGPSPVSVSGPTSQTFYLYNDSVELAQKTITTSCADGPTNWDTVGNVCANPQIENAEILNQHYPPGSIRLECSGATTYSITTDVPTAGTVVVPVGTPYTAPVVLDTPAPYGNSYTMRCTHGSVYAQTSVSYDPTMNPTVMIFNPDIPVITDPPGPVPLTWSIAYPDSTCTLSAKVVCANNACSVTQQASQTALNNTLQNTSTDLNDPNTTRPMLTALRNPAPGHKDSDDPVINPDYKAIGKKTIQISHTTDITLDCSGNKITRRIRVTKNEEQ